MNEQHPLVRSRTQDHVAQDEAQARALLSGSLFVISILMLFLLVVPTHRSMRTAQDNIVLLSATTAETETSNDIASITYASLARNTDALERADIALPQLREGGTSDVPELIAAIEALVERDVGGLFLETFAVGSDDDLVELDGQVAMRPVTLAGLAARLLDAFRGMLHLVEPVSLHMEASGNEVVSFSLELERAVLRE